MILVQDTTELCALEMRNFNKPLENSIFIHFVYRQAEKIICSMWYFNGPSSHVTAAGSVLV